jgi:hypothetical protein
LLIQNLAFQGSCVFAKKSSALVPPSLSSLAACPKAQAVDHQASEFINEQKKGEEGQLQQQPNRT